MNSDSRLGAAAIALSLVWGVAAAYVVISQLPGAAIQLPAQRAASENLRLVAPQGWAFFTKSAREPSETAWCRSADGAWRPITSCPRGTPRTLGGFDRRSRAEGIESGILLGTVPAGRWHECGDVPVTRCLDEAGPAVPVRNPSPVPILCGSIGLTRQEPLPWAWAASAGSVTMPASAVLVEVRCSN